MTVPGASDGLIRPVNAPSGTPVLPGVQPGVSGQVVLAQYVIVFGVNSSGAAPGVFIYAPGTQPAPGNGPIYYDSGGTEDPYGNPIAPGIFAGQYGTPQAGLSIVGGYGQVVVPTGAQDEYEAGGMAGLVIGASSLMQIFSPRQAASGQPLSDRMVLDFYAPSAFTPASSAFQTVYIDAAGTPHSMFYGTYAGTFLQSVAAMYGVQPGTGTSATNAAVEESWHNMSLSNGWAQVSGGMPAQYRILGSPANTVEIRGNISGTAETSAVFATLPAGYQPAHTAIFQMQPTTNPANQYYGLCASNGQLSCIGTTLTSNFNLHGYINLDS
jgi:hypothetical protein